MKYNELLRLGMKNGWVLVRHSGSYKIFKRETGSTQFQTTEVKKFPNRQKEKWLKFKIAL